MTFKQIFCACSLLAFSLSCEANAAANTSHAAIQGAISTGGNLGIALANYSERTEIGLTLSGKTNNKGTGFVVPALFAGIRHEIGQSTYFAYGIDLASKFGEDGGRHVDANVQVGPYISLEQALTNRFLLVGWIEPYTYEYEKLNGYSTTTQRVFGAGGIGISYYIT